MTVTFSVTYEIPVSPERIAEIDREITSIELRTANSLMADPSYDRSDADLHVTRLRAQMEPERRRDPAVMRLCSRDDLRWTVWDCPRCARNGEICSVAVCEDGVISIPSPSCPNCEAEVHKEELPMSLDLYRMRTRRTDGVEVQAAAR